jgi:ferredoxin--NADP+ reductase
MSQIMKILNKEVLSENAGVKVVRMEVYHPDICRNAKPGQFIAFMVDEKGERVPLTIVDKDPDKGSITLIFQEAGLSTRMLAKLNVGDSLYSLAGPLGHPTEIKKYGKVVMVGGGVGIAEILPVARALKAAGNYVVSILGSRTKDLLILEAEMKATSDEFYVMTDDGSYGKKGFTTDALSQILKKAEYDLVYCVGPLPMMRRISDLTRDFKVKTLVSLNALMVDATGMCGCCRVTIGGSIKFSCVDGPDFDAHLVDWDELSKRSKIYLEQEKHNCKLCNI